MAIRPNYHHLYHFWMVAQEGSLAAASRRLGVRHSTLSSQLQALEKSIGARLLLRRPRGVRLTPQGEIVRGYCDQIFRLGTEMLEATSVRQARRLRAGVLGSLARSLVYTTLLPALDEDDAPRMEIVTGELFALCRELVAGRLHMIITDRLPSQATSAIYAHPVGKSRIGIFGTRRLAARHRTDFPAALDGAPLLLPAAGSTLRDGLVAWFAEEGIRLKVAGEFDDIATMLCFAEHGHGLVPLRYSLAGEAREHHGLEPLGAVPVLIDHLYALTLGRRVRHPGIQRLIERAGGRVPRR